MSAVLSLACLLLTLMHAVAAEVACPSFSSFTFTGCNTDIPRGGPVLAECQTAYGAALSNSSGALFSYQQAYTLPTQGQQFWRVPSTGTYTITVAGAAGGAATAGGMVFSFDVSLAYGQTLLVIVGQQGAGRVGNGGGGGGGLSGVYVYNPTTRALTPLGVAAGSAGESNTPPTTFSSPGTAPAGGVADQVCSGNKASNGGVSSGASAARSSHSGPGGGGSPGTLVQYTFTGGAGSSTGDGGAGGFGGGGGGAQQNSGGGGGGWVGGDNGNTCRAAQSGTGYYDPAIVSFTAGSLGQNVGNGYVSIVLSSTPASYSCPNGYMCDAYYTDCIAPAVVAVADSYSVRLEPGVDTLDVLANDINQADDKVTFPLSISSVTQPAEGGSVAIMDNKLVYTRDPLFKGIVTFTYTVTNSLASANGTVTVKEVYYSTPACTYSPEGYPIYISCPSGTGPVVDILYARYGDQYVASSPVCGQSPRNLTSNGTCEASNAFSVVTQLCLGQNECRINLNDRFGDPCFGYVKYFIAQLACECPFGFADCDGNPANKCECSPANALPTCRNGACAVAECKQNYDNCDGNDANGCEIDLRTNVDNCGTCGNKCTFANAVPRCSGGVCGIQSCNAGWANCDGILANGCETDLRTLNNCGTCNTTCGYPNTITSCATGECRATACVAGYGQCDGNVANGCEPLNTKANCGMCGSRCDSSRSQVSSCSTGTCVVSQCACGMANCNNNDNDGCEQDIKSSLNHCGGCYQACQSTLYGVLDYTCQEGTCGIVSCQGSSFLDCDGIASNGCEYSSSYCVPRDRRCYCGPNKELENPKQIPPPLCTAPPTVATSAAATTGAATTGGPTTGGGVFPFGTTTTGSTTRQLGPGTTTTTPTTTLGSNTTTFPPTSNTTITNGRSSGPGVASSGVRLVVPIIMIVMLSFLYFLL